MFLLLQLSQRLDQHIGRAADLATAWRERWMLFVLNDAPRLAVIIVTTLVLLRIINVLSNRLAAVNKTQRLPQTIRFQQIRTAASVIRSSGTFLVLFIAVLETLKIFSIDIAPLLASAGVAGLAIGFGAQTLVKDMITGFFILFENQFDIGDIVRVAGVQGTVEDVKLRSTVLRDINGALHIVPNSQITIVSNLTRDWNQLQMHVSVDYGENSDKVIALLQQVAREISSDPALKADLVSEVEVQGIERITGREVAYLITAKVRPYRQAAVSRELRRRIKECLEQNNIKAGAPVMVYAGDAGEKS